MMKCFNVYLDKLWRALESFAYASVYECVRVSMYDYVCVCALWVC